MSLCAVWMRTFVLFLDVAVLCGWGLSYFQVSLDVTLCCVDEGFCSLSRCHKMLLSLCCVDEDFCSVS